MNIANAYCAYGYSEACKAVTDGLFCGITIVQKTAKIEKLINRGQFYQALVDSLSARLMPESERPVVDCLNALFPSKWADTVAPEYGEQELKQACKRFMVNYSTNLKQEYRDFKDVKGAENEVFGRDLKKLVGAMHTLPVSTAECERGFSQMNVICTPLRTRLTVCHMSSLLFISIVGPPLHVWQPISYVKSWLAKGRHAATDLGKAKSAKLKPEQSRVAIWMCF